MTSRKKKRTNNHSPTGAQSTLSFGKDGKLRLSAPKNKQRTLNFFFNKKQKVRKIKRAEEEKQRLCKNEVIMIDEDSDQGNIKQEIEKNSASSECSRDPLQESSKTKQSSSPFSILSNAFQICTKTKGRIEITNTLTDAFLTVIKNNPTELFPAICLASDTLPPLGYSTLKADDTTTCLMTLKKLRNSTFLSDINRTLLTVIDCH